MCGGFYWPKLVTLTRQHPGQGPRSVNSKVLPGRPSSKLRCLAESSHCLSASSAAAKKTLRVIWARSPADAAKRSCRVLPLRLFPTPDSVAGKFRAAIAREHVPPGADRAGATGSLAECRPPPRGSRHIIRRLPLNCQSRHTLQLGISDGGPCSTQNGLGWRRSHAAWRAPVHAKSRQALGIGLASCINPAAGV